MVFHVQNGTLCLFWVPSSLILSVLDTELGHFMSRRPAPAGGSPGDIRGIPGTPYPQDYDREFTPADLPPERVLYRKHEDKGSRTGPAGPETAPYPQDYDRELTPADLLPE